MHSTLLRGTHWPDCCNTRACSGLNFMADPDAAMYAAPPGVVDDDVDEDDLAALDAELDDELLGADDLGAPDAGLPGYARFADMEDDGEQVGDEMDEEERQRQDELQRRT